ncbi:MAG: DNA replication and repair protein RecF [Prevotella sp.]|nr:DNA replication and repair protein RecF [Prevotella sp.]
MILKKVSIINYKNLRQINLDLSYKMNCFIGGNGEGKTNLLDAIYYLSFCHSAFNPIDSQLITHGEDFFVLEGSYEDERGEAEQIYCGLKRGTKKRVRRNKKDYKRLSQHIGLIPLIFVSPSDIYLIEGASEERRRLMDVVISQYDGAYIDFLNNYNKALQQRNTLLRQEEEPDPQLLTLWEEEMARNGEQIYQRRSAFIEELIPTFQNIYDEISSSHEKVSLRYVSHCQRGPLLDVIQRDRMKDRAVGYSLHGIHRDDLEMEVGGFTMKREGSQGQNKTYVISLKLAQFNFLRRTSSATTPILLLDDIFDKLDKDRVEQIIRVVSRSDYGQIFITDTNRHHLDDILANVAYDFKLFNVKNGEVSNV